jgi:hypothetical protein
MRFTEYIQGPGIAFDPAQEGHGSCRQKSHRCWLGHIWYFLFFHSLCVMLRGIIKGTTLRQIITIMESVRMIFVLDTTKLMNKACRRDYVPTKSYIRYDGKGSRSYTIWGFVIVSFENAAAKDTALQNCTTNKARQPTSPTNSRRLFLFSS